VTVERELIGSGDVLKNEGAWPAKSDVVSVEIDAGALSLERHRKQFPAAGPEHPRTPAEPKAGVGRPDDGVALADIP
jgi:hypothetical protein